MELPLYRKRNKNVKCVRCIFSQKKERNHNENLHEASIKNAIEIDELFT